MLKIFQNPYNSEEYSITENHESVYHETNFEGLASSFNGDEIGLVNFAESIGVEVEYFSHINNKYVLKEEYLKHFENYDSDKEFILPSAKLTKAQAETIFSKLS